MGSGAVVLNSVIMNDSVIGRNSRVDYCILDKKVTIGDNVELGTGDGSIPNKEKPEHLESGLVVIGKGAEVPANTKVGKNSILYPKLRQHDYPGNIIEPGETIRPKLIEE